MWNFIAHNLIHMNFRDMPTYSHSYAKVKIWIFNVQFPGNWYGFGIILNDFRSSTIQAIQIYKAIANKET